MMKRKRAGAALLALVLAAGMLSGCEKTPKPTGSNSVFHGDSDALRIFVRGRSNYREALLEQFPDIKFDFYTYAGQNTTMAMERLLKEDDFGDICFNSLQVTPEVAEEHLIDLSGYSFCDNYEPSILSQFDVNGKIYQVPGYVSMRFMVYNKDMFQEHGWKEPKDFDALVRLCRQIRKETDDITPLVMGGAASGYYFTIMTTYAQSEFLYTPDGKKWTEDYLAGNAKAADGFGSGIKMTQELIDAEALDYDQNFGDWDANIFRKNMLTEKAAMMYGWGQAPSIAELMDENPDMHFGIMPLRNREGRAFIGTNISYNIGLAKSLLEKGNEKKLENALRVMEWLTTEEGISSLAPDALYSISPVKDAKNHQVHPAFKKLWDENLDGIKAPMLYAGYEDILEPTAEAVMEAVQGERTLEDLPAEIDECHQKYLEGGDKSIEVGSFAEEFTHEQTVQFFADLLYGRGDSDLALVSDGGEIDGVLNDSGVYLHFFAGPLIDNEVSIYTPGKNVVDMAQQLTLSGAEIRDLIENGLHVVTYPDDPTGHMIESDEGAEACAEFPYYWSGVEVERKDGKVVSITKEDGTKLEDDKDYTVTFAVGDYTDVTFENGNAVPLSYTIVDAVVDYMKENSPVKPPEKVSWKAKK